jgi:hypothetical protein
MTVPGEEDARIMMFSLLLVLLEDKNGTGAKTISRSYHRGPAIMTATKRLNFLTIT